ncbi:MAG: hypothetical protein QOF78_3402 [Phycisphaerales bacterium]|jgi:GNAT superfamily N-acetyltransferase|nr:hypothetical protein [Phycisphaerales bacterium]
MSSAIVPIPRSPVSIRPAVAGDYAFIDRLQDMHSKALGFMRKAALEGKIELGEILVAEDEMRLPIGYCISSNRYLKRDELGVVYQMNVVPGAQRKLVAATLLKAVFERAPYGCRLFCCWCAQDLDANYFWESLGFIPLAFRTGASGKRTHIFWQRRIGEADTETPYWYPSKTDGGMMREDRLVLPIPPGVHWKEKMPILLPEVQQALPDGKTPAPRERSGETPKPRLMPPTRRGARFGAPSAGPEPKPAGGVVEKAKPRKPKREKVKADPAHVAAARELRDRWLEQVNAGGAGAAGGAGLVGAAGKYEVSRALPDGEARGRGRGTVSPLLLPHAA